MQHLTDPLVTPSAPRTPPEALRGCSVVHLAIAGMECEQCANRVRNALMAHAGVREAETDAGATLARVWYDASRVSVEEILGIVAVIGARTQHQFLAVPLVHDSTR